MLVAGKLFQTVWTPFQSSLRHGHMMKPCVFMNMLKNRQDPCCAELANGLRVAVEPREGTSVVCVGLFIDAGSRHESLFENGMAHFFEHIAFRGTRNRSPLSLQSQMNCTGAIFKSYTTRELVAYYAVCQPHNLTLIIDLLTDCVFNNCLSNCDIERQKEVVYKEMKDRDVDHNATMFDYLHAAAYMGTPLAQSVIGPSTNLENISDMTLGQYLYKVFNPCRTVLAAVGAVTPDQVVDLANLYLAPLAPSDRTIDSSMYRFTAGDFRYRNDSLALCNAAVAFEAPSICSHDSYTMDVAAALIGGWDRSQPCGELHAFHLAQAGYFADLCEAYQSFYIKYSDGGLWGVQFTAKPLYIDEFIYNINTQLLTMCLSITENEVERAKNVLKTRLLMRHENVRPTCLDLGRETLYCDHQYTLMDRIREIDNIHSDQIRELCTKLIYDKDPAVAAVGPCESLPEYPVLRAGLYWLRS